MTTAPHLDSTKVCGTGFLPACRQAGSRSHIKLMTDWKVGPTFVGVFQQAVKAGNRPGERVARARVDRRRGEPGFGVLSMRAP